MEVGDKDNYNSNALRDNMHDWVVANETMAKVLAAKKYHYQFVFARNAGHTDAPSTSRSCPRPPVHLAGLPISNRAFSLLL